ncbi:sigma-54 dependent transcriptional regulator [Marivita sp. S6314]|uniref:sigma-54-dependent transcriptional regulator n=1 Tax=Marivita sp. S6314 TaxID=2926406 RepID=UPI001FF6A4BA|nr:sigma-54 dependent transcriptional regulator [Marivita sp. S6314]MCK0148712.1 sigma-54 dependent transcriptional regulator [Marivita sp. S6314]
MIGRVLLVDDDPAVREALGQTLELADYDAITAGSFVEAKDHITARFDGVIVSDMRMPGRDGFHLLDYTRAQDEDLPVILLTGEGDIPMAVDAMGRGAFAFLEKPCAPGDLTDVIAKALKTRSLVLENRRLKAQLETGDPAARMLFGTSPQAEDLRAKVRVAAKSGTDVLVTGEPGTGISKVAEVIHLSSSRTNGPFVKRASAQMSRDVLAELWASCRDGTLFLDDIGQLPTDSQMALLDLVDQDHTRLIAGSTTALQDVAEQGSFNTDLFYRLSVMQVRIPSIAERPGDIPVLFRHYVAQSAEQAGLDAPVVTSEVVDGLMARPWPGNARALMSEAMRFVLGVENTDRTQDQGGLVERLAQVEKSILTDALQHAKGQASVAAEALHLPRKTFYDKLAKYGLRPESFR